jgi:hypothetical protein
MPFLFQLGPQPCRDATDLEEMIQPRLCPCPSPPCALSAVLRQGRHCLPLIRRAPGSLDQLLCQLRDCAQARRCGARLNRRRRTARLPPGTSAARSASASFQPRRVREEARVQLQHASACGHGAHRPAHRRFDALDLWRAKAARPRPEDAVEVRDDLTVDRRRDLLDLAKVAGVDIVGIVPVEAARDSGYSAPPASASTRSRRRSHTSPAAPRPRLRCSCGLPSSSPLNRVRPRGAKRTRHSSTSAKVAVEVGTLMRAVRRPFHVIGDGDLGQAQIDCPCVHISAMVLLPSRL